MNLMILPINRKTKRRKAQKVKDLTRKKLKKLWTKTTQIKTSFIKKSKEQLHNIARRKRSSILIKKLRKIKNSLNASRKPYSARIPRKKKGKRRTAKEKRTK